MEKLEQDGRVGHDGEGVLLAKFLLRRRHSSRDLDFQAEGTAGTKTLGQGLS